MPSPIVHSQQGLGIAGLLLKFAFPTLNAFGLGWTLPLIIAVIGYFAHLPLDCVPHADTVVYGSDEDFDQSMALDPKKWTKEVGLWPVFTPGSRETLRKSHPQVADPPPVDVTPWPMTLALYDVAVAFLVTVAWLWPYLQDPFTWICLGAGAFGAVLPDLVLAKPIHRRLIKYDWFWRLDYLHHWVHASVMLRKDRIAGTIIQIILFGLFGWFAWTNRPHP